MVSIKIASPVIVLAGPTAIGKTDLSLEIAEHFDCEIISMDSMQVYRYMDIGTAKVSPQERAKVAHHLIDICDPDDQYNAARFVDDAISAMQEIIAKGKVPFITGGTGLYLSALLNGLFDALQVSPEIRSTVKEQFEEQGREAAYNELKRVDPESAARIHSNDTQRLLRALEIYHGTGIPWSAHLKKQQEAPKPVTFSHLLPLCLTCERELLYKRIEQRTQIMLNQGLLDEVNGLLKMGYDRSLPSMQAIGYKHAVQYLSGEKERSVVTQEIVRDTRRYAKRQMTWFNHQQHMQWVDREDHQTVLCTINNLMEKFHQA